MPLASRLQRALVSRNENLRPVVAHKNASRSRKRLAAVASTSPTTALPNARFG